MGKTLAVVSGSGGTGKSTVAAELSRAFARSGNRTLLWELTPGIRCCDTLLNVDGVTLDLSDVLAGRCPVTDACLAVTDNLWLLPAPLDYELESDAEAVLQPGALLVQQYDFVILDLGCDGMSLRTAARSNLALFCCTPTALAAAACERAAQYVREQAGNNIECGLVVNRVPPIPIDRADLDIDLSGLIDRTHLSLRAVIPESEDIFWRRAGAPLSGASLESRIFDALCQRVQGRHVPMLWK